MALAGLEFAGYWDAAANSVFNSSPESRRLIDGGTPNPKILLVVVAGTTKLGGVSEWLVGDWAVNFGYGWGKFSGAASLLDALTLLASTGKLPLTPGNPGTPRMWINGDGDGTGVLTFS